MTPVSRMRSCAWFAVSAASFFLSAPSSQGANPTFTANASVHDPSVVRDGANYYVFGSHLASASTSDLMNWTQISTLPAKGNALVPDPATEFAETLTWAQATTFWAPDVVKLADGKYYFYYCACKGDSPRSALGLAVADKITGPYKNVAILLKSGMWGQVSPDGKIYDNAIHPNTVDPSVFFDKNGKFWMVYGSYSGGIFIMELDPTTGLQKPNQGYGKKLIGGNNTTIEGPYIIYSPETDYYYLFVTYGGLDAAGGYNIRVGRSRSPDGPYLDSAGADLTNVKGAFGTLFDNVSIAPYGVKLMGNYKFLPVAGEPSTVTRGYLSPGGSSIYRDAERGRYLLFIHTRFVGRGEEHEVRVFQLYLNEDGWFVASPTRFAGESIATTDVGNIPGNYKLVNHGHDVTATVKYSVAITLKADGTITGSATGTWQKTGDHYATVVLGGKTYKGVFVQVWDDDNKVWVMSFTALSSEGICVWGCKVAGTTTNTAPSITTQPVTQAVVIGKTASLSVAATAVPAPSFQWQRNGVNITGATKSTYDITSASDADAGAYTVVVSNSVASFQSAIATVTVNPPPPVAPSFTTQPSGATVIAGQNVTFTASAVGTPEPTFQWMKDSVPIAGATGASFSITGVQPSDAGSYTVVATNGTGSVTSDSAVLVVKVPPPIALQPQNADVAAGQEASLSVSATGAGLTYQWRRYNADGSPHAINGATSSVFGITGATSEEAGLYDCVVTGDGASSTTVPARVTVSLSFVSNPDSRLVNLSARTVVGSGSTSQIAGFSITGTGTKTLLLRANGPSLTQFHVEGVVADPFMDLFNQSNITLSIDSNDDWSVATGNPILSDAFSRAGAFPWVNGSSDAALLETLDVGNYTAKVQTKLLNGVGLAEVYEMDTGTSKLTNLSARSTVGAGAEGEIAGFVIRGPGLKTVLIRVSGPALNVFSVTDYVPDPLIHVFNQSDNANAFALNDDWDADPDNGATVTSVAGSVGAFPWMAGSKDAALVLTLREGNYSAVATAKDASGVGLIEVYEINR